MPVWLSTVSPLLFQIPVLLMKSLISLKGFFFLWVWRTFRIHFLYLEFQNSINTCQHLYPFSLGGHFNLRIWITLWVSKGFSILFCLCIIHFYHIFHIPLSYLLSSIFYCWLLYIYSKTSSQLIQYPVTFSHLSKASYSNLRNVFSEATFCLVLCTPLPPKSLGQALHVSLCKNLYYTFSLFPTSYDYSCLACIMFASQIFFLIIQMPSILFYLWLENPILLPVFPLFSHSLSLWVYSSSRLENLSTSLLKSPT